MRIKLTEEQLKTLLGESKKKKKKGSKQPQGPWVNICRKPKDFGGVTRSNSWW